MSGVAEIRQPELDGAGCVHAAIETASCRACVESCPMNAWRLDDAALEFDAGACDGCGLCVPACPRRAIRLPLAIARRQVAGTSANLAACDRITAASHAEPGSVPCLHAIGLADLLLAYRAGRPLWLLAQGNCADCPRGGGESLSARVARLNTALRQRGRPAILLREMSISTWKRLLESSEAPLDQARRGFFRALSRQPAAALLGEDLSPEPQEREPPGQYLPGGEDALLPWVVRLDLSRCTGCHACARVCPEGAIRFIETAPDGTAAYRISSRACSGCGLCRDVCDSKAVGLQPWAEPKQTEIALKKRRCRGCGVAFHQPDEAAGETRDCWICARTRPPRRLYQVMS